MKAKKHPLLGQITGALSGRLPEEDVEVFDHTYRLRVLMPEAEDWVAMNTKGSTIASALFNVRKPTLACAITAIDGSPIESLFQPPDELESREELMKEPRLLRDWRREQILDWLKEEVDSGVIDRLYAHYTALSTKHREALKELENFSKRTPS